MAGVGEGGISERDTSECMPEDFLGEEPRRGCFRRLPEDEVAVVWGSVRLERVLGGVEGIFHAF